MCVYVCVCVCVCVRAWVGRVCVRAREHIYMRTPDREKEREGQAERQIHSDRDRNKVYRNELKWNILYCQL